MGTHVLTGFVMTAIMALGHFVAMTVTMSLIIPALTLKRSSRVMPGLRGTPAGITTSSAPTGKIKIVQNIFLSCLMRSRKRYQKFWKYYYKPRIHCQK